MSTEQNKAILRQWLCEMWGGGDLALVDELASSEYVYDAPGIGAIRGGEALKDLVTKYRTAFPDLNNTIENQVAEGDQVVTRGTTRGTHLAALDEIATTGKAIVVPWVMISRIVDGKIVEEWELFDALSMMQQLGVLPG